jgi:uncharacterized protein
MNISPEQKIRLRRGFSVFVLAFVVAVGVSLLTELIRSESNKQENTISFSGTGEISAAPDLATVSLTIIENAKEMKNAQDKVTAKETAVLAFLDKSGVAKKDIKTENYSSYPKYEYQKAICPPRLLLPETDVSSGSVSSSTVYCPSGKQVLTGYEVSENISVKIHDLTKAGDLVQGIGDVGISNISGPNFSIDKEDALKEQARKIAIDDAKAKAKTLSKDLGVRLVRIVSFSENGNYPTMYSSKAIGMDSVGSGQAPAPALPTGENKITSNVTITYEIR